MPHPPQPEPGPSRRARPERDPLVGTRLDDRYQIEARIALGGFGAVYRARTAEGALVALKVLQPSLTGDPNMVARFRREGATLTQLHDPHTVTTLAVGETDDGTLYIAMELLTGDSLHDRLCRDGALPWRAAVAIARAVCSSLAEAHALGVVHRDLKPANIHVETRHGADFVKVIDFGIAKVAPGSAIDDGRELTFAGHMIGTFDYMAPEQLLGAECRERADVYALGVVLYEMLTGRRPFGKVPTPAAMMTAMLTQIPERPVQQVSIPVELSQLVMRCLEREPDDRFASMNVLAAALDRVVATDDAVHEAVTTIRPAWDPRTMPDEERTWIDPAARPAALDDAREVTTDDHRATLRDPWHLPLAARTSARTAPVEPPRRTAGGTGPGTAAPLGFGLALEPTAPRVTPVCASEPVPMVRASEPVPMGGATLPGVTMAARTPPRGVPRPSTGRLHAAPSASSGLPTAYADLPAGWCTCPPPHAPHAPSTTGPASTLAMRPAGVTWRAIWLALLVACVTTLVLAGALGAIP